jgi:hypothetical protein
MRKNQASEEASHGRRRVSLQAAAPVLGIVTVCAAVAVCTLYVTKSTAQDARAAGEASPIYGVTIPAGYRDWHLISVGHLTGRSLNPGGGNLKQLRAQLGNDIAIKAFREGKRRPPVFLRRVRRERSIHGQGLQEVRGIGRLGLCRLQERQAWRRGAAQNVFSMPCARPRPRFRLRALRAYALS